MNKITSSKKWIYKGIALLIIISCMALFFELADELNDEELIRFDTAVMEKMPTFHSPVWTSIFSFFTSLASVTFTTLITCVLSVFLFFIRNKIAGILLAVTVTFGGVFNYVLKTIYERQRPEVIQLIEVSGFSFPSGHVMNALSLYGILMIILVSGIKRMIVKILTSAAFITLILIIGLSRIYLGVHYPSDIAAGYVAGSAWLLTVLIIYRSFGKRMADLTVN